MATSMVTRTTATALPVGTDTSVRGTRQAVAA